MFNYWHFEHTESSVFSASLISVTPPMNQYSLRTQCSLNSYTNGTLLSYILIYINL